MAQTTVVWAVGGAPCRSHEPGRAWRGDGGRSMLSDGGDDSVAALAEVPSVADAGLQVPPCPGNSASNAAGAKLSRRTAACAGGTPRKVA